MKYQIIIKKQIDNPNYDDEFTKEYYRNRGRGYSSTQDFDDGKMTKIITVDVLTAELTEEEFKAVKKSCIDVA